jgi:hypothetical protein
MEDRRNQRAPVCCDAGSLALSLPEPLEKW